MCDYGFLGEEDEKALPILIIKEHKKKRLGATFVEKKGVNNYARQYFADFVKSTGYRNIVNKSDGEPAIVALKNQAVADVEPQIEAIAQEIPADDHAANGEIEVAVFEG